MASPTLGSPALKSPRSGLGRLKKAEERKDNRRRPSVRSGGGGPVSSLDLRQQRRPLEGGANLIYKRREPIGSGRKASDPVGTL